MMSKRLLLVEDDPGLSLTLTDRLTSEGYEVEAVADGDRAFARATADEFDLVILDVILPGRSGFDVCRDLRQKGVDVPVLMLTARGQVADRVVGLKLGADDYLTKPFEMSELLARVEARVRRVPAREAASAGQFEFGQIRVDFDKTEVSRDGKPLELSAKEFRLLCYLIERRGKTITRNELLDVVWGYDAMPSTRTVDVHVAWLRKKLEPQPHLPRYIVTVHGIGYKFVG
jgi:two-component system alkaline phosphatase synthesis response regulator PhoP